MYSTLFICACAVAISLTSSCQILAWRTEVTELCCVCRFAACRPYFVAYIVGRSKLLQVVTYHFIIICEIRCIWSARNFSYFIIFFIMYSLFSGNRLSFILTLQFAMNSIQITLHYKSIWGTYTHICICMDVRPLTFAYCHCDANPISTLSTLYASTARAACRLTTDRTVSPLSRPRANSLSVKNWIKIV